MVNHNVPCDRDAEEYVLGACLLGGKEAVGRIAGSLNPDDFYYEKNGLVYLAMRESYILNEPIDMVTIGNHLEENGKLNSVGGRAYIATLETVASSAANIEHYAKIVKDHSVRRRVIKVGTSLIEHATDLGNTPQTAMSVGQQKLLELAQEGMTKELRPVGDHLSSLVDSLEAVRGGGLPGLSSGFPDVDRLIGGLRPAEMIVIAGRTSMGKSALAMQVALHQVQQNIPVAVFSLEMSTMNLVKRLACTVAEVDSERAMQGNMNENEWARIYKAMGPINDYPLYIDDSSELTVTEMMAKVRALNSQVNVGMVVVDYIQMVGGSSRDQNRNLELSAIARGLRSIAKELDIPVLVACQLSRAPDARSDHRPMLSDLRESGGIEEAADVIVFPFRPEYYDPGDSPGIAEIIVGKNRNGGCGTVELKFTKSFTKFGNLARRTQFEYEEIA